MKFEEALTIFNNPWMATEEGLDEAEEMAKKALEMAAKRERLQFRATTLNYKQISSAVNIPVDAYGYMLRNAQLDRVYRSLADQLAEEIMKEADVEQHENIIDGMVEFRARVFIASGSTI